MPDRAEIGADGERLAIAFLRRRGFRIVARNFQVRGGEIDVIAHDRDTVVFVEVRTRSSSDHGSAGESIDARKRQHMVRAAQAYLQMAKFAGTARIDVVTVDHSVRPARIEHIIGAVDGG
jgi:putative endonuclease